MLICRAVLLSNFYSLRAITEKMFISSLGLHSHSFSLEIIQQWPWEYNSKIVHVIICTCRIHTTQKSIGNPMLDKAVKMHIIIGEEQRMTAAPQ